MNINERRRYDMFIRVAQFGADNTADFPAGSVGAAQFGEVTAVIDRLQELLGEQSEGFSDARFEFNNKDTARENLREEISDINRTARSMVYAIPGIDETISDAAQCERCQSFSRRSRFSGKFGGI